MLLVCRARGANGFMVIVFDLTNSKREAAEIIVAHAENQSPAELVIFRAPPGVYTDPDRTRRIRILLDGVQLEKLEASSTVYFGRNGHFDHIVTSY